jgi:probable rRNA maturation factor
MLGDVVICKEKAEEQAEEFGHSFKRELIYLFTHSVLHLLGYDHEEADDKTVMRKREEEIMDFLGIPKMN